jgi:hypothetical protein
MKTIAALLASLGSFAVSAVAFACPGSEHYAASACGHAACSGASHFGEYGAAVGIGLLAGLGSVALEGVLKKK